MARVVFLGVGDATDFELGQSSVLYEGSVRLLIDCGPQIPLAATRSLANPDELDGIYLTHRHADHCFGLGSLLLWMRQRGRRRPLSLIGETSVLKGARELVELAYPGAFAAAKCFGLEPLALTPKSSVDWCGIGLSIAPTEHGVPNFAIRIDDGPLAIAQSGDGRSSAHARALYDKLDLLIHECAWLDRTSGSHSNVEDLVNLFHAVQPRRMAVLHCAAEQRAAIEAKLDAAIGNRARLPQPGAVCEL